jgi:hypothetical protein
MSEVQAVIPDFFWSGSMNADPAQKAHILSISV